MNSDTREVAIIWRDGRPSGRLDVCDGALARISLITGTGSVTGNQFAFESDGPCRMHISCSPCKTNPGPHSTIVTFRSKNANFSFFLRDINRHHPIFLPGLGISVTEVDDTRSYARIAEEIHSRSLQTARRRIEAEPEENFELAAARTRPTTCPTWLGFGRDIRIFEVDFPKGSDGIIFPRLHNDAVRVTDWDNQPLHFRFACGRGVMCAHANTRRLEEGVLPILHGVIPDEEIRYEVTTFVVPEAGPLQAGSLRGTNYLVAYSHGIGAMLSPDHQTWLKERASDELNQDDTPVLFMRIDAINTGNVPRYAWIKSPVPAHTEEGWRGPLWTFEPQNGFSLLQSQNIFCISRLNGAPLPQPETSILLMPGEVATFELQIPHRPIPRARAAQLSRQSFVTRHAECRAFWMEKLGTGARIQLPEQRIDEMIRAGLLHLDLVCYGQEPDGPIAACTGKYTPIGTESAPIIQFLDSMGHHDLARRALMFFLELQREDGSLNAFYGYLVETGAILWTIGEHYRYTRDDDWARKIERAVLKACEHLISWRDRNKLDSLRGRGYGMIDGAVCDFPDPYRHFILNGYACLGLSRVSEMLTRIDPAQSARLAREADEWKRDIRESLFEAMARSPVVPLRNGEWCPTAPPWAEGVGPVAIFADNVDWYSKERHEFFNRTGAHFPVSDSLLGPHYLIFQEVLGIDEPAAHWLHEYHVDLFLLRNVASGQPYYCRHPWIHLKRGEVKGFLKAYYNTMAAQADRETYSFPEGIIRSVTGVEKDSPHKTHEEGWFLLETRWMLYMEEGQTLRLLPGIPRKWLEGGKSIRLDKVATYFGAVSLLVQSDPEDQTISAKVECHSDRQPRRVVIRLPHPLGRLPREVRGGEYDAHTECVQIDSFHNHAEVVLRF